MSSEHSSTPPLGSIGSPRTRQLGLRPPALSTPMSGPQLHLAAHLGAFQAPASPTSLSPRGLPFAGYNQSIGISSPGGMSRGPSPLTSRSEATVPYNPQQWASAGSSPVIGTGYSPQARHTGSTTRSAAAAREGLGLEAPVPSPPPPYSPQRPSQASTTPTDAPSSSPLTTRSPATHHSRYATPISAGATISPGTLAGYRATPLQRPTSLYQTASPEVMQSSQAFPPPPPSLTSGKRSRSSSRDPSERSQQLFSLSSIRQRPKQVIPTSTRSAIDVLQHHTNEVLARAPSDGLISSAGSSAVHGSYSSSRGNSLDTLPRAPASRRAASTGNIDSNGMATGSSRRGSRSPSRNGWEPGMPLPPPPPGPPPTARSQSLSRSSEGSCSSRTLSTPLPPPATRRPPGFGTSLDPVPPTPAGWVDEEISRRDRSTSRQGRGLYIDTNNIANIRATSSGRDADFTVSVPQSTDSASANSLRDDDTTRGDIARSSAIRESGNKGIRERRSESRTGKGRVPDMPTFTEQSNNPWAGDMAKVTPADLVLPGNNTTLTRRRTITKSSPRSAKFMRSPKESLNDNKSPGSAGVIEDVDSTRSTPLVGSARRVEPAAFEPTPPFSPEHDRSIISPFSKAPVTSLVPKSLPTPPPQRHGESSKQLSLDVVSINQQRPISHILHTPNTDASIQAPLSPSRPPSQRSDYGQVVLGSQASFARSAIARHNAFAEREAEAKSDQERVELFAEFIVTESRLRRERYAVAIESMGPHVNGLTKNLFKPMTSEEQGAVFTVSPSSGSNRSVEHSGRTSHRASLDAAIRGSMVPSVQSSQREPESPISSSSNSQPRPESGWFNGYMPSLSPIPSMGMSTIPDELSSRGRAPSRWWEASQEGSINGGFSRNIERSKRESKYMGVPREMRESLQWIGNDRPSQPSQSTFQGSNRQTVYGQDEYPPEKTGWHDQEATLPPPPPPKSASPYTPGITTPNPRQLDVSRLVTLPPPYPRHHPAVNNSHPELVSIRSVVRSLSDFSESTTTKERYETATAAIREQARQTTSKRWNQLRADIQRQVSAGTMSYTNAAAVEAAAELEETQRAKERAQSDFDRFQSEVMKPLHSLFNERIARATVASDELRGKLFVDAQEGNPNLPQEEGDEQPELLEKLTLLKWLFEAREQLHREVYELLTERNNKYKAIVITPYRVAGNEEKAKEAEDFFRKDAEDRKVGFEKDTLKRVEEFMHIVEENVIRGVEVQLSAFWDIAPSLRAVMEKIPRDLVGFEIQIPTDEYEENPQYMQFPLQYLYSLLGHSEKSTYQFIESQINLLCLLHEVKSAVTASTCRLMETQRYLAGEDYAAVEREMKAVKSQEEGSLTDDLKEKVGTVEEQWAEALGRDLDSVKLRVKDWLVSQGGWEDENEA